MINAYTVLLSLHILAAVLWVGGGGTLQVLGRQALASGDRARMQAFSEQAEWIGPRFYAPLSVVLMVAGLFLVDQAGYEFSELWVGLGMAGWFVSFVIGIAYYPRAGKKRDQIIATEGLESGAFLANYKQAATVNLIELLILAAVVVEMAIKPT